MPDYLQHGRRHLPTGSDPIPNIGSEALPYATVDVPSWTWTIGDQFADFSSATVTISDPSVFTDNTSTDGTTPLKLEQAGIYLAWGLVGTWNAAWGTQARVTSFGADFQTFGPTAKSFPLGYAELGGPLLQLGIDGMAIIPTVPFGGGDVRLEVNQNSGSDRNVSLFVRVIRLSSNGDGI